MNTISDYQGRAVGYFDAHIRQRLRGPLIHLLSYTFAHTWDYKINKVVILSLEKHFILIQFEKNAQ